jgi:hypothetical protein
MNKAKMSDGTVGIVIALIGLAGVVFESFLSYRTRERDRRAGL